MQNYHLSSFFYVSFHILFTFPLVALKQAINRELRMSILENVCRIRDEKLAIKDFCIAELSSARAAHEMYIIVAPRLL